MSDRVMVSVRPMHGHRVVTYSYRPMPDMLCQFHLLSEVGEPWQAAAKLAQQMMCAHTKSKVVQVELPAKPWFVDALVKE